MPASRKPSLRAHLAPRQKLWLNWDGAFLMGPRYLRFLDAVERTGTIRAAGQAVGWSYRTCLNRIRQMERVLGAKVLETARGGPRGGGGARLTPEARRLVALFAEWRREVERLSHEAFRKMLRR
jgi:molybdate transport system regulatory protein